MNAVFELPSSPDEMLDPATGRRHLPGDPLAILERQDLPGVVAAREAETLLAALGPALQAMASEGGADLPELAEGLEDQIAEAGIGGVVVEVSSPDDATVEITLTVDDVVPDAAPLVLTVTVADGDMALSLDGADLPAIGPVHFSLPQAQGSTDAAPVTAQVAETTDETAPDATDGAPTAAAPTDGDPALADPEVTQTQLQSLASGIASAMNTMQTRIEAEVLAELLPLVGAGLQTAAQAGQTALAAAEALGTALSDALTTLAGATSQTTTAIETALNNALASAGFAGTAIGVSHVGGEVHITVDTGKTGSFLQSLAADLGMAGLTALGTGNAALTTTFDFDLDFATGTSGFFLDTSATQDVAMSFTLDSLNIDPSMTLSGQSFDVLDAGTTYAGTIGMDLQGAGGMLTLGQLGGATLAAALDGALNLSLDIQSADKGAMTPPIASNFTLAWDFIAAGIDPGDNNASFGELPDLGFETVTLDLGTFMENFIGPMVEKIDALLEPVRPIIAVLDSSIGMIEDFPGLGDLLDVTGDGRVTLLDVMSFAFPALDTQPFETLIQVASDVADWAAFLNYTVFSNGDLVLGEFGIGTGDIRLPGFELKNAAAQFGGMADSLQAVMNSLNGVGWETVDPLSGQTGLEILGSLVESDVFSFPLLTEPAQWMNLMLGNVTDLVEIDLPEVVIGTDVTTPPGGVLQTETLFKIPIYLGLFLKVGAGVQARIDMDFGFDTRGLIEAGRSALDGLYIVDHDDKAEILLRSNIEVGLELNALLANITGAGNVQGEIELDLKDSLLSAPGKIYFDDFAAALATNPFSLFDATGKITAGFSAYVETFLGNEIWRWDSPRVTLGNFSFEEVNGESDPNLADLSSGTLTLHTGGRAHLRAPVGWSFDLPEIITVGRSFKTGKISVSINQYNQDFNTPTHITGNGRDYDDQLYVDRDLAVTVNFYGGDGNDVLSGADLSDSLFGGTGSDVLYGNDGDDSLVGGTGNDVLIGGAGADTIDGGDGIDRVIYLQSNARVIIDFATGTTQSGGHAQGDILTGIENIEGSLFDDYIRGAQGAGDVYGHDGNDTMIGGTFDQALYGGRGEDVLDSDHAGDTLAGGQGDDTYYVRTAGIWFNENELQDLPVGSDSGYDWVHAWVDVDLRGMDDYIERITLYSPAKDAHGNGMGNRIDGNEKKNTLRGYDGDDKLYGKGGKDTLYGGEGDDLLNGGKNADLLFGGTGNDTIFGMNGTDDIRAGDGDDLVFGGFGTDTINGGLGADTLWGGADMDYYIVDAGDEIHELPGGGLDFVFANESHSLIHGQEVEIVSLYSWDDIEDHPIDTMLAAVLLAIASDDYDTLTLFIRGAIFAGWIDLGETPDADLTGNNYAQILIGESTDIETLYENILEGAGGADTIFGDHGKDFAAYTLSDAAVNIDLSFAVQSSGGHAAGDYLYGIRHIIGSDFDDVILGESTLAGAAAEYNNQLFGGAGNDLIQGFGGLNTLKGGEGDDTLIGGDDYDTLRGNDGDDSLVGGHGDDVLDGGAGDDTLDGGGGDDRYTVTTNDVIFDSSGDDTVVATEHYYLAAGRQIETLKAQAGAGDLILFGNTFDQDIDGNEGNNTIHGGAGADVIDGGDGMDTAVYTFSSAAVQVNLNLFSQTGGHAQGDILFNIENLRGSIFGDTLIGLNGPSGTGNDDNEHYGEAGHDWIEDVFGQNTLHGEGGNDTLIGSGALGAIGGYGSLLLGGLGDDSLDGGVSTSVGGDTLVGGMGDDTYHVTSLGDVVDENWNGGIAPGADGGHDTLILDVAFWDMEVGNQGDIEDAILGALGEDVYGNALGNLLEGNASDNDLRGREGNDTLEGKAGNDTLRGGTGNDNLKGGTGDDEMYGWEGNDKFYVNSVFDLVIEEDGNGHDTVRSSVDYTLTDFVEDLVLTGSDAINGIGNTLDNEIIGNEAANELDGGGGADTLEGGDGNDVYIVNGSDTVIELAGQGIDVVKSSASYTLGDNVENLTLTGIFSINGTGNGLNNFITGNGADNRLDGGQGADTLIGGYGNDTYYHNGADTIVEGAGQGVDLVESTVAYTLTANVENLLLLGTGGISGTGNNLDNNITGNSGANTLDGAGGADTLAGGAGNDTYIIDGNDTVVELYGEGTDLVRSSVTYSLASQVENLTLTGTGSINGFGNGKANVIIGNSGNNILNGWGGADTLTGGSGADRFLFRNALTAADHITDFATGVDEIRLDDSIFTTLATGSLSAAAFRAAPGGIALSIAHRILYDSNNGNLYYDEDGSGSTARVLFAVLDPGLGLSATDFWVI